MFPVDWSDKTSETVGERQSRKWSYRNRRSSLPDVLSAKEGTKKGSNRPATPIQEPKLPFQFSFEDDCDKSIASTEFPSVLRHPSKKGNFGSYKMWSLLPQRSNKHELTEDRSNFWSLNLRGQFLRDSSDISLSGRDSRPCSKDIKQIKVMKELEESRESRYTIEMTESKESKASKCDADVLLPALPALTQLDTQLDDAVGSECIGKTLGTDSARNFTSKSRVTVFERQPLGPNQDSFVVRTVERTVSVQDSAAPLGGLESSIKISVTSPSFRNNEGLYNETLPARRTSSSKPKRYRSIRGHSRQPSARNMQPPARPITPAGIKPTSSWEMPQAWDDVLRDEMATAAPQPVTRQPPTQQVELSSQRSSPSQISKLPTRQLSVRIKTMFHPVSSSSGDSKEFDPQTSKQQPAATNFSEYSTEQRLHKMRDASILTMIERLEKHCKGGTDVLVYKDLEYEKKLWLLTTLDFLIRHQNKRSNRPDSSKKVIASVPASGFSKVLSLYEPRASATYLTAFTSADETHHLAVKPASPVGFLKGKLIPLSVPTVSVSLLQYPPQLFSSVHALTLPYLIPASSMPQILKACHRILLPNGTLCMTLLSPSPQDGTTGPRLGEWLKQHLIDNFEGKDVCIEQEKDTRYFYQLLDNAGFDFDTDTDEDLTYPAATKEPLSTGGGAVQNLTVLAGRLLWKQLYERFLTPKQWWWEDEKIVEECLKWGTIWKSSKVYCRKKS